MQIDLNESEIKLIDTALETWEKDARSSALMGSMFGAMLTPKSERAGVEKEMKKEMAEAEKEGHDRRVKSILLRAKLYQALSRESEHTVGAES